MTKQDMKTKCLLSTVKMDFKTMIDFEMEIKRKHYLILNKDLLYPNFLNLMR